MKSKTSLFKKGLIISDLKRFWWVSALYTLALFFSVPFNHYIQKFSLPNDDLSRLKELITRELNFYGGSNQVLVLFVPIIITALVFRYIQKGRSASLYHSLPLTRAALYLNSLVSTLILFVTPVLFTAIIMLLLNCFSYLSAFYTVTLIFSWLAYSLLFGIMFIAMTVFVGMFTGNSVAQVAFVYILNFLPMFLVEFVRMNLKDLLFGFDTYSNVSFYNNMPMAILYYYHPARFTAPLIIVYIAVTIALFIGGLIAFKLRKPETAGDIITFKPIRPLFIYGVTVCATLLGGAYFMQIGWSSLAFIIFGYFVSSLVSYIVVQMLTNKTFKVMHTYKGYVAFALVLIVMALGIKFDVLGYVNKIPNTNDIEEAFIGYNLTWWENKNNPDFDRIKYDNENTGVYKDSQNIENITKLHKLILDNRSNTGNSKYIAYKLKNGKQIVRRYIIDTDMYASALGPMYESKEYKNNRYPILHQEASDVKYIEATDSRFGKNPFVVSDKAQLDSFKTAIRKDIENLSYQDLISDYSRALLINIVDNKDSRITYGISESFVNTIDWLKKEGIYDEIILKPDYIDKVTLIPMNIDDSSYVKTTQVAKQVVEIKDKAVIKELLDLSLNLDYRNKTINYSVNFYHGNNAFYGFQMSFGHKVSSELQSYVNKLT